MPTLRGPSATSWAPIAAAAVPLATYLPSAVRRYGWSDDLPHLFWDGEVGRIASDARPLKALVFHLVFSPMDDIDVLAPLRVIGILGLAFLAWTLTRWFQTWQIPSVGSAFMGATTVLLPSFQIFGGWATTFAFPWVAAGSAMAGLVWVDGHGHQRHRIPALLVMTAGLSYYPPAAMFCWAILAIRIVATATPLRIAVRHAVSLGLLVLLAGASAFTIARITVAAMNVDMGSRVGIISLPAEIAEKLVWFITHPLIISARPFQVSSPSGLEALLTAGPVLLVIVGGLWSLSPESGFRRVYWILLIALLVSASFAVHLAVRDNQIEFRFMAGITAAIWLLLYLAARQLLGARLVAGWPVHTICVTLVLMFAMIAARNVHDLFVRPTRTVEHFVTEKLDDYDPALHLRIVVVNSGDWWPPKPNLGIFSTRSDLAHGWVEEPLIRTLLSEGGHPASKIPIMIVDRPNPLPSDLVIDFRSLRGRL